MKKIIISLSLTLLFSSSIQAANGEKPALFGFQRTHIDNQDNQDFLTAHHNTYKILLKTTTPNTPSEQLLRAIVEMAVLGKDTCNILLRAEIQRNKKKIMDHINLTQPPVASEPTASVASESAPQALTARQQKAEAKPIEEPKKYFINDGTYYCTRHADKPMLEECAIFNPSRYRFKCYNCDNRSSDWFTKPIAVASSSSAEAFIPDPKILATISDPIKRLEYTYQMTQYEAQLSVKSTDKNKKEHAQNFNRELINFTTHS